MLWRDIEQTAVDVPGSELLLYLSEELSGRGTARTKKDLEVEACFLSLRNYKRDRGRTGTSKVCRRRNSRVCTIFGYQADHVKCLETSQCDHFDFYSERKWTVI